MTGFARVRRAIEQGEIVLSLKSVNHRGLDLHFHMPPEFDALENDLRTTIKGGVARGHIQIHLSFSRTAEPGSAPLNRALLDAYIQAFAEATKQYRLEARPDLNSAFRIPGMLSTDADHELAAPVATAVIDAAAEALALLNAFREREGAVITGELRQRCANIAGQAARMEEIRAGAVPAFHKRLRDKLSELLHGISLDPQRLAQEAAILADRSDIAEELVRLRTHVGQVEAMLVAGGEVGKRLDFLLQEMNRETNTILSKTGGLGDLGLTITDLALGAKSEVDKIREQALNLE